MPAKLLTGFFGKLPFAGDFVTRGLPAGFQAFWDGWATRHLAGRHDGWPDGGLRLRLVSGGRVAAGVALAGRDRVGRRFPLAAFVIAPGLPLPHGLDPWCGAVAGLLRQALTADMPPDALDEALDALPLPEGAPSDAAPAFQLWSQGQPPRPCDPADPAEVLDQFFSCSGSSHP